MFIYCPFALESSASAQRERSESRVAKNSLIRYYYNFALAARLKPESVVARKAQRLNYIRAPCTILTKERHFADDSERRAGTGNRHRTALLFRAETIIFKKCVRIVGVSRLFCFY